MGGEERDLQPRYKYFYMQAIATAKELEARVTRMESHVTSFIILPPLSLIMNVS